MKPQKKHFVWQVIAVDQNKIVSRYGVTGEEMNNSEIRLLSVEEIKSRLGDAKEG
jgi:hypothetical protein